MAQKIISMRILYCLLFFFIFIGGLSAQRNYRSGYIITNDNDSIIGLIDFRTDLKNGESCRFKKSLVSEEQLFYPADIAKYKFVDEGKYYISHEVEINKISKKVFLEYLLQGVMDLYYYHDQESGLEYYFFQDKDTGRMIPITKRSDEIVDYKYKRDMRYRSLLLYLFRDQPTMKKTIEKSSFRRGNFVKIAEEYHNLTCSTGEPCIVFMNDYKRQFFKVTFSAYTGVQFIHSSLKNEASDRYALKPNLLNPFKSLYPMIGGQIDVSNPRWSRWVSLQADLSLSAIGGSNDYSWRNSLYYKYKFNAMMANGNLDVKYTIPLDSKFKPSIQGGFSYILLFATSGTLYEESYRSLNEPVRVEHKDYFLLDNSHLGFNLSAGVSYSLANDKEISLGIMYEKCESRIKSKIQILQMKVGYTF